jgi:hypothetical protein
MQERVLGGEIFILLFATTEAGTGVRRQIRFLGFPAMFFSQICAVQIGGFFLYIFVDIFIFSL